MFRQNFLKYNEAGDGGAGAANNTPPPNNENDPSKKPPNDPPPQDDGLGFYNQSKDDKGGEANPGGKKEGEATPPKDEKKDETKPEDQVSGYGAEPPKDGAKDEKPSEPPKQDPPKDEGLGYELDLKEVEKSTAEALLKIAKEQKLSKEQAEAFVQFKKQEIKAQADADAKYEEEYKAAQIKQKQDWYNELKNDADFGKDKFNHSVARVEKFISEMMPDTKKVLTERRSMLPPYVMKDILRTANKFYDNGKFVQGEQPAAAAAAKEKEADDPLAFYK